MPHNMPTVLKAASKCLNAHKGARLTTTFQSNLFNSPLIKHCSRALPVFENIQCTGLLGVGRPGHVLSPSSGRQK